MYDGKMSFILVVFDPAPNMVFFNSFLVLAPTYRFVCQGYSQTPDFTKGNQEDDPRRVEMEDGGMLQTCCLSDCTIGSPMEYVQAITGIVPPFGIHRDSGKPDGAGGDGRVSRLFLSSGGPAGKGTTEVVADFPHSMIEGMDKQDMTKLSNSRDELFRNI